MKDLLVKKANWNDLGQPYILCIHFFLSKIIEFQVNAVSASPKVGESESKAQLYENEYNACVLGHKTHQS